MRDKYNEELDILNNELIKTGALIESAIANAVKALTEKNSSLAYKAMEYDKEVDQKEKDIESLCYRLLLKQQPVASDLRLISAALKMITDMERIGDQAADISEIATLLLKKKSVDMSLHIPVMAKETIKMVNDCINAFINKDIDLALAVIKNDDKIDTLFDTVKHDLIEAIKEKDEDGENVLDLLMVAKYLERIGDHATNIAEWVVFSITGYHKSYNENTK